ncbi:restriction endonuclease subunit S [Candidatus Poribacteria bacterium]|nr:restriction endonuclease subunit S [Candidatus Poribacteria bacterium]
MGRFVMPEMNLPEHWKEIKLSNQNLFSFESGIWKGKKEPFEECAVVRNTNFTSDGYLDLKDVAVLPIEQRHLTKKSLKWGDIIIERSGGGPEQPVGRVVFFDLNDETYCFSNFTSRLRVIDKSTICPTYLFFYLLHFHASGQTRKLQKRTTGIRNLIFGDYKESRIPLPPLPEQRSIVHVLQTIQEAKFTRQREIALERERKAALMDYLFSHGTKDERRKQTEIGEIPENWEIVQLKEIANLRRENVKPKDNQNLNFVGLEHIDSGESTLKRWGDASAMKSAKNRFYPDDVLYGKLRSYLDKAVIAEMEGICSTDILVFTANSKIVPRFLVYLLHTEAFVNHAVATSTGISHPRTSWDSLGKFTFALPSLSEQRAIAAVFQAIDEKTAALEQEVEHLDELFRAMLDELMTGQRSAVPLIDTEMDV